MRIFFLIPIICTAIACQKHPAPQLVSKGDPREVLKNSNDNFTEVQSLEILKKLRFSNANLFLWKENQNEADLTNAIRNLRKYDEVEDDSFDFNSISAKLEEISSKKADLQNQLSQNEGKLSTEEKQKLSTQLDELESMQKQSESLKAQLMTKYKSEESFFAAMENNGARLETLFKVVDSLETSNPVFSFDLNKETPTLTVSGVSFLNSQSKKSFSTLDESIINLEFKPQGALLNFDVVAAQNVRFEFRLRRTNYQDKAGRIIFKGDLKRITFDDKGAVLEKRIGQAKLSTNPRL